MALILLGSLKEGLASAVVALKVLPDVHATFANLPVTFGLILHHYPSL